MYFVEMPGQRFERLAILKTYQAIGEHRLPDLDDRRWWPSWYDFALRLCGYFLFNRIRVQLMNVQ